MGYPVYMNTPHAAEHAVLAIDQGGHSTRCLAFDARGRLLAQHRETVHENHPAPGFVEQDPEALLSSLQTCLRGVMSQLRASGTPARAAGLATQRASLCAWRRPDGTPLTPVVSWQDTRNAELCAQLAPQAALIQQRTGLVLSPHYGASKLRWLLDHEPALARAHATGELCAGPLASFLLARLLAEHPCVADPVNGARTQLRNRDSGDWDPVLLDLFGIPRDILPRCVANVGDFGHLPVDDEALPLRLCTGDQNAAVYAWGEPLTDTVHVNIGTGAFVLLPCERLPADTDGLLASTLLQTPATTRYALEGTINGGASALDWLAARHGTDANAVIAGLPGWLAQGDRPPLFLNGISGLAAPWWRADFHSRFIGGRAEASLAGEAVAVVESIVFLAWTIMGRMRDLGYRIEAIQTSGGLAHLDGLCQRLADLTRLPVERPGECEATARGTAWLLWQHGLGDKSLRDSDWRAGNGAETFTPRENPALGERYRDWLSAMESALE